MSEWLRIFQPCIADQTGVAQFVDLMHSGHAKVYRIGGCWVMMTVRPAIVWGCVGIDICAALETLLLDFPQFVFPTNRKGMPRLLSRVARVVKLDDRGNFHVIRQSSKAEKQQFDCADHH